MQREQKDLRWFFCIFLPKFPVFLLALPFVLLMRGLRPIIWMRLIPVKERIGHGLGNTDVYLRERRAGLYSSHAVDIFYPDRPWKCNRQMIKMWKRLIPLYDLVYWLAWADKEIPGFKVHHFDSPHADRDIHALASNTPPPVSFNATEEERGAALLRDMGVPPGSQIVCFHGRDSSFLKAAQPKENYDYHNHRDVDINSYGLAIKELVSRGYYCIRMGRVVNQDFLWQDPHLIDYTQSLWRSDFADMYLISRCNFYIGMAAGIDEIAAFFRKPQVVLNIIPMGDVYSWAQNYLNIFKKIWLIQEKRFLTFKEIIGSEVGTYYFAEKYKKAGLEVTGFEDLTSQVWRTWWLCLTRAAKAIATDRAYRAFLLDPRNSDRSFAIT